MTIRARERDWRVQKFPNKMWITMIAASKTAIMTGAMMKIMATSTTSNFSDRMMTGGMMTILMINCHMLDDYELLDGQRVK